MPGDIAGVCRTPNCHMKMQADVRFGSEADIHRSLRDVCFVPEADMPMAPFHQFRSASTDKRCRN
jgi:hypothetical protein